MSFRLNQTITLDSETRCAIVAVFFLGLPARRDATSWSSCAGHIGIALFYVGIPNPGLFELRGVANCKQMGRFESLAEIDWQMSEFAIPRLFGLTP